MFNENANDFCFDGFLPTVKIWTYYAIIVPVRENIEGTDCKMIFFIFSCLEFHLIWLFLVEWVAWHTIDEQIYFTRCSASQSRIHLCICFLWPESQFRYLCEVLLVTFDGSIFPAQALPDPHMWMGRIRIEGLWSEISVNKVAWRASYCCCSKGSCTHQWNTAQCELQSYCKMIQAMLKNICSHLLDKERKITQLSL